MEKSCAKKPLEGCDDEYYYDDKVGDDKVEMIQR